MFYNEKISDLSQKLEELSTALVSAKPLATKHTPVVTRLIDSEPVFGSSTAAEVVDGTKPKRRNKQGEQI